MNVAWNQGGLPVLRRNAKQFRGGLVSKAHRRVYHSTLGSRVIKKRSRAASVCEFLRDIPSPFQAAEPVVEKSMKEQMEDEEYQNSIQARPAPNNCVHQRDQGSYIRRTDSSL